MVLEHYLLSVSFYQEEENAKHIEKKDWIFSELKLINEPPYYYSKLTEHQEKIKEALQLAL